jgi:hypothetical protein
MDTHAARKARRDSFKPNLAEAYTDEEATPPEWVDLATAITEESQKIRARITEETDAFVDEPDIRRAIARRERTADVLRKRIAGVNRMVGRLNLIAPHQRFTKAPLDADALLRPLFRTARRTAVDSSG